MPGLLTNDMPGTPGAISQMLGLLMQQPPAGQPGQPAPPPVAPMPMNAPHPMEHVEPAQSLLGKIHDYISDRVGIREPGGYRGLLSDEEIQQAKPGILASGAGDSWREKLDSIVKMKQFAAGLAEQNRIQKVRSDMPQNLDLPGMLKYAAQHGDVEMIKTLGGPLEGMLSAKPTAPGTNMKEVPGVGLVDVTDPAHPKVVMHSVDRPTVPNFTAVPGVGPDGTPVVYTLNTRSGKMESTGVGRPTTENPQQQLTAARATAGIAEMNNANGGLREYEDKLINGAADIKGLDQFIGSVGDSFLLEDPKSKALQAAALTKLNRENPELARYIRRGLSFAEGETGISQRPSDYRTKLAAFLSTASAGASPEMIADIRSRRESILGAVNSSKLAPKSSGKPKPTQAQYDEARSKYSDSQLAQHYDLSGVRRK